MSGTAKVQAPAGATDTHMHFYGPYDRWPLSPLSPNTPPEASVAAYRQVQARLGLSRVVVVQAAGYRTDNRCTMAATAELAPNARAVVVVEPDAAEAELAALTAGGAVGLRVFLLKGGVYDFSQIPELAVRTAAFGWHLQVQLDGRQLPQHESLLTPLARAGRLVIDHTGKFLVPVPPEDAAFLCLRRLVDAGAYVKLSAPYETSLTGAPGFTDVAVLGRVLVGQAPERMLWATNWPHPGQSPMPDDRMMLDWLGELAPDEAVRRRILVDNPARLYRFD
jgi:D-galactarolactone isomerase